MEYKISAESYGGFFSTEKIQWLFENNITDFSIRATWSIPYDDVPVIYFCNEDDAAAFKLRWI